MAHLEDHRCGEMVGPLEPQARARLSVGPIVLLGARLPAHIVIEMYHVSIGALEDGGILIHSSSKHRSALDPARNGKRNKIKQKAVREKGQALTVTP